MRRYGLSDMDDLGVHRSQSSLPRYRRARHLNLRSDYNHGLLLGGPRVHQEKLRKPQSNKCLDFRPEAPLGIHATVDQSDLHLMTYRGMRMRMNCPVPNQASVMSKGLLQRGGSSVVLFTSAFVLSSTDVSSFRQSRYTSASSASPHYVHDPSQGTGYRTRGCK